MAFTRKRSPGGRNDAAASHHYNIESSTRPGLFHTVDVLRLSCSCEAGARGRRCHHLADAIMYDQWRKRQRVAAAEARITGPERGMAALQAAFQ